MLDGTREILAIELQGLIDIDFEVELTGFNLAETDFILDDAAQADPEGTDEPEGAVPSLWEVAGTCRSDVWLLERHKLICGDARVIADYHALLGDQRADLVITDPPYQIQHIISLDRWTRVEQFWRYEIWSLSAATG